ncbi:MAG: anti-anti-sigma factor [Pseudohongiellaceae bacterium]|jgi:anti-anti-sigma factor
MLVADHQGTYLIKLIGDVRLTLCNTLDSYMDDMFGSQDFTGVTIDLSDAQGIDSTSLGLLAKLAINAKKRGLAVPTILSPNADITRLLESMGFHKIFNICCQSMMSDADFQELPNQCGSEENVRTKVIEAHKVLMGMNDDNFDNFAELVSALESSKH